MSLPRIRASDRRSHVRAPSRIVEPDASIVMPAVQRLRAAKDDLDLQDAIASIPPHLLPAAVAFAGDRQALEWGLIRTLLAAIGLDALVRSVGETRACVLWKRYRSSAATDEWAAKLQADLPGLKPKRKAARSTR